MINRLLVAAFVALACGGESSPQLNAQGGSGEDGAIPSALAGAASGGSDPFTFSDLAAFAGSWEAVSEDGTNTETAEIEITDGTANGILRSLERGYYSGKVTVTGEVAIRGTLRDGGLDLKVWNTSDGSFETAVPGRAVRRGEYLIVRVGDGETDYAKPGVSLVRTAEGSKSAEDFARAIAGRIYSSSSQASGRGAFVGGRVRLALCADGSIAFDASDVATTGSSDAADMGSTTSRRGEWSVVLFADVPVVRAQWNGTGSSYSLIRYFRIQPAADGSSARIDGTSLSVTGSC